MKIISKKKLEIKPHFSDIRSLEHVNNKVVKDNTYHFVSMMKPWGSEHFCFKDNNFDIWELFINPSNSTSSHLHINKDVFVVVIEGSVNLYTTSKNEVLTVGDFRIIKKKALHQFANTSKNVVRLLEIESPPNRNDLIRVKDDYGRDGLPYLLNKKDANIIKNRIAFKKNRIENKYYAIFDLVNRNSGLPILTVFFKENTFKSELSELNIKNFFVINGKVTVLTKNFCKKNIKNGECFTIKHTEIFSIERKTTLIYWN